LDIPVYRDSAQRHPEGAQRIIFAGHIAVLPVLLESRNCGPFATITKNDSNTDTFLLVSNSISVFCAPAQ
jgi:hypothetical protein